MIHKQANEQFLAGAEFDDEITLAITLRDALEVSGYVTSALPGTPGKKKKPVGVLIYLVKVQFLKLQRPDLSDSEAIRRVYTKYEDELRSFGWNTLLGFDDYYRDHRGIAAAWAGKAEGSFAESINQLAED
jgi:hypothetical protein